MQAFHSKPTGVFAQKGDTLLETMISVLILSIGLLGLTKLQFETMRQATDSRYVVIAGAKAQSIMDDITYERELVGGFAAPFADSNWKLDKETDPGNTPTDPKLIWLRGVKQALPGGTASIGCASAVCTITIYWNSGKSIQLDKSDVGERSAKYVVQNPSA